jgi:hypothetical protein
VGEDCDVCHVVLWHEPWLITGGWVVLAVTHVREHVAFHTPFVP